MPQPPNHACFEAAAADLLHLLYQQFPAPLAVKYEAFYEAAVARGIMPPHCQASFTGYHTLYGATLEFLHREGVVHISQADAFRAQGVALTPKGFLILRQPLALIEEATPPKALGEHLAGIGRLAGTEARAEVTARAIARFCAALGMAG